MNFVVTNTNFDTCNPWKKIKYSAAIKAHFNLIEKLSSVQRLIFVGDWGMARTEIGSWSWSGYFFHFFLSCHSLFFFLNVFLNADDLVTECVCGIFHIDDDDVSAFYAFQELLKKMSHGRTQANSSVPRNPNYINLLILNPYLLLSGNANNGENLKTTIFLSKKHVGMRDCRIMLKR